MSVPPPLFLALHASAAAICFFFSQSPPVSFPHLRKKKKILRYCRVWKWALYDSINVYQLHSAGGGDVDVMPLKRQTEGMLLCGL